ncbi:MAG: galactosyltransferase-related protein [Betaproteobacteria bacterium]
MTSAALTFVTTCKGRLRHLRTTLPLLAAQPDAACVVVDYDCPERSGDWVAANFPRVEVVRWSGTPGFNPAHARNLGVAAAKTSAICLIDADVLPAPGFSATVLAAFDPRRYYLPEPLDGDVSGTLVCAHAAFNFAEGYDEACSGWGGEDLDLYDRFEFHGLERAGFAATLLRSLPHSDAERTAYHEEPDKEFSNSINLIYSHIKLDLMRLSSSRLPLGYRRTLHERVRAACTVAKARGEAQRLTIPYADTAVNFNRVQAELLYSIEIGGANPPWDTIVGTAEPPSRQIPDAPPSLRPGPSRAHAEQARVGHHDRSCAEPDPGPDDPRTAGGSRGRAHIDRHRPASRAGGVDDAPAAQHAGKNGLRSPVG